jgi:Rod binding domain-containing protein
MQISSAINLTGALPEMTAQCGQQANQPQELAKAAQQFESILLRQFLSESMKSLAQGGEGGQVYGYMITDSLANSLADSGGMGLSSVLQVQLGGKRS